MSRLLWLAALLTASCGGRTPDPAPEAAERASGPPRLLILSSLIGYVEPCGCTVDLLLGGIDRAVARVAAERAQGPTAVLVVGPTLFEKPVADHQKGQEQSKARLLGNALRAMGVEAFVPSATDLVEGRALYTEATRGLPDVTVNVPGGAGRVITLGAVRVGVFGLAPAGAVVPGGTATDPAPAAAAAAGALRAQGATVIVALGALPRRTLRQIARVTSGVDVWVLGDAPEEEDLASRAGEAYIIEAGDRGRNVGRLVLHEAAQAGPLTDPVGDALRARKRLSLQIEMRRDMARRMPSPGLKKAIAELKAQRAAVPRPVAAGKRFEYTLLPLPKTAPADPKVRNWVQAWNAQLKTINLAAAGAVRPVPEGQRGYVGDAECADCHDTAVAFWKTTRHARAWQTLVEADKIFDAECVSCHVVGWQQPGGTVLGKTAGKENVQCEACHGPGSLHVAEGGGVGVHIDGAPTEARCVTCHNSHHSPKFDFATYRATIIGSGHGAP